MSFSVCRRRMSAPYSNSSVQTKTSSTPSIFETPPSWYESASLWLIVKLGPCVRTIAQSSVLYYICDNVVWIYFDLCVTSSPCKLVCWVLFANYVLKVLLETFSIAQKFGFIVPLVMCNPPSVHFMSAIHWLLSCALTVRQECCLMHGRAARTISRL